MEHSNFIITFANQKGGVGKSTLCALFANYLHQAGIPVWVVDCDGQSSMGQLREKELQHNSASSDAEVPYPITIHSLSDKEASDKFIMNLMDFNGVVLIDSPGNLKEKGLVSIFANSDFIICPFLFEKTTVFATSTFILLLNKMRSSLGKDMTTQLLFVPNRVDNRFGTEDEKKLWSSTKIKLGNFGAVTPDVGYRACMQRYSTVDMSAEQINVVKDAFEFISETIGIKYNASEQHG